MHVNLFGHSVVTRGYSPEWRVLRELVIAERNRLEEEYTLMARGARSHTPHERQQVFERWQLSMHILKTLESVNSD